MKNKHVKKFLVGLIVVGIITGVSACGEKNNIQKESAVTESSESDSSSENVVASTPWDESVDVDWTENSLKLSTGINMTYLTLGPEDGTPIILIHGATDSRLSWFQVAPDLAEKGYRVYIPELRGHGKTDKPQEDAYTLEEHTADIKSFIDQLGLKKVNLAGHSLGTFISEELAANYPDLVTSVTLIGAGYKVQGNEVIDWVLNGDGASFQGVNAYQDGEEIPDEFVKEWTTTVNEDQGFATGIYEQARELPNYAWRAIFNGLNGQNISEDLAKIKAPVQIIWGSEDTVFPKNEQEELIQYLTNASFVNFTQIDGADHNTHWTSAEVASQVADLIAGNVEKKSAKNACCDN